MKIRIIFVCLGNICRSPGAEAVFKRIVSENNCQDQFYIDSAGTCAFHEGEKADSRMRSHGVKRGFDLTSISRKFDSNVDFDEFDFVVAMDSSNYDNLCSYAETEEQKQKIVMMTDYCTKMEANEVPDPYYGGEQGFELVFDILEDACENLLTKTKLLLR